MTTVEANPPRWVPDPAGRFAQRYWDGHDWTDFVAGRDGGAATTDPLGTAPLLVTTEGPVPELPVPSAAAPPERPAGWERDPTGRHPQRYWDGAAWTGFVAGVGGGAARIDPIPLGAGFGGDARPETWAGSSDGSPSAPSTAEPDAAWPALGLLGAATPSGSTEPDAARPDAPPAGEALAAAAAERHRRRLTKPVLAALVLLALLLATAGALDVAGVFGGHGSSATPGGAPSGVPHPGSRGTGQASAEPADQRRDAAGRGGCRVRGQGSLRAAGRAPDRHRDRHPGREWTSDHQRVCLGGPESDRRDRQRARPPGPR